MWVIEREIELKYDMVWFESGLGQKSDENDGFCPFKIGENIDDISIAWKTNVECIYKGIK